MRYKFVILTKRRTMDFSIFNRKKQLNETCELMVVDFVNKRVILKKKINNLLPLAKEEQEEINSAVALSKSNRDEYIKKEEEKESNAA